MLLLQIRVGLMGCRIRFVSIVLVLVVLSCAGLYGRGSGGSGLATVNQYLDLLAAGNFEIAGDMWTPQALERASRVGISDLHNPLKV